MVKKVTMHGTVPSEAPGLMQGNLTTLDTKRRAYEGIPKEASDIYIVSVDPVPAYRITGQVNGRKAVCS